MWDSYLKGYKAYLHFEKSLSELSVQSYLQDMDKLIQFLELKQYTVSIKKIELKHLREFINWINELGMQATSQARIISGIKSFFNYLVMEDELETSPAQLLEVPKTKRKLPETLTYYEIEKILESIDVSTIEGARNKTIIETLYSCGLRVSELCNLQISNLFLKDGFIKVKGKGAKERLIPIGESAIKLIEIYKNEIRKQIKCVKEAEDILFLNRRGNKLSRVMIFYIIRDAAKKIQLSKNIHPHTLRHSFASHLVDGGADLRAVQEMLGHESITTTEIYTHLDKEYLRDTIRRFHPRYSL